MLCLLLLGILLQTLNVNSESSRILNIDVQGWGEFLELAHSYAVVQRGVIGALQRVVCLECGFQKAQIIRSTTTPLYQTSWLSAENINRTVERLKLKYTSHRNQSQSHSQTQPHSHSQSHSQPHKLEATLRFTFPFDLSPSNTSKHTFVFATTEFGNVSSAFMVQPGHTLRTLDSSVTIVTPSEWSRVGFLNAGVKPERVIVLRHGVNMQDIGILPSTTRFAIRLKYFPASLLHINDPRTAIYINVGSMTYNKGFDVILDAFVQHHESSPSGNNARLLLKGLDAMYKSNDFFHRAVAAASSSSNRYPGVAVNLVKKGIIKYIGERLSSQDLKELVCSSDVYLTPYRAEGFNMPAQEAAACGLTVIATSRRAATMNRNRIEKQKTEVPLLYQGIAPTDGWCRSLYCRNIQSRITGVTFLGQQPGYMMAPDVEHLRKIMRDTTTEVWRRRTMTFNMQHDQVGPNHIAAEHTWNHVGVRFLEHVDNILNTFLSVRIESPLFDGEVIVSSVRKDGIPFHLLVEPNRYAKSLACQQDQIKKERVEVCALLLTMKESLRRKEEEQEQEQEQDGNTSNNTNTAGYYCVQLQCHAAEKVKFDVGKLDAGSYVMASQIRLVKKSVILTKLDANRQRTSVIVASSFQQQRSFHVVDVHDPEIVSETEREAGNQAVARRTLSIASFRTTTQKTIEMDLRHVSMITTPMMPDNEEVMAYRRQLMHDELDRSLEHWLSLQKDPLRFVPSLSPSFPFTPRSTFSNDNNNNNNNNNNNQRMMTTNGYPSIPNVFSLYWNMSDHLHMMKSAKLWYHLWNIGTDMTAATQFLETRPNVLQASKLPSIGFLCANLYVHSSGKAIFGLIVELSKIFEVVVFITKQPPSNDLVYMHVKKQPNVKMIDLFQLNKNDKNDKNDKNGKEGTEGTKDIEDNDVDNTDSLHQSFSMSKNKVNQMTIKIREYPVDVLIHVDVGVDPLTYALALVRHAPIQIAFWGNPITTGMPWSIDYFVVGKNHNHPNTATKDREIEIFSEQVVQLNGFATYYYQPSFPKVVSSDLSATNIEKISDPVLSKLLVRLQRGRDQTLKEKETENNEEEKDEKMKKRSQYFHVSSSSPLLVSVQSLVKMHPSFDRALRTLLVHHLPTAHVVLLAGRGPMWSYQLKQRLARLAVMHDDVNHDVNVNHDNVNQTQQLLWTKRIHILQRLPALDYALLLQQADVLLDSFPYSGFTTSIEALALGVPIVTLDTGTSLRGSQTASLYRTMNNIELYTCCLAESIEDWIEKITKLANNSEYRTRMRIEVQKDASILFENIDVIQSWKKFLIRVYKSLV